MAVAASRRNITAAFPSAHPQGLWIPPALWDSSRVYTDILTETEGTDTNWPSSLFDMPVFFGRDLGRFPEFISAWYGKSPDLRPLSDAS